MKDAHFVLYRQDFVLSTRLIWPAPMPNVIPLPQNTIALDLTNLATRQAKSKSSNCFGVGCFFSTRF
jgi:hypothetical protein